MSCSSTLDLLSRHYPNAASVLDGIAQIQAKLTLPRPVTHVISDVHGEHAKLRHVINNSSGDIRTLINAIFGHTLDESEKQELLAFLYYPVEKMQMNRDLLADKSRRLVLTKRILRQQFILVQHLASEQSRENLLRLIPDDQESLFLALLDELAYGRDHSYVDSMLDALSDYNQDVKAVHMASRLVRNLSISDIVVAGDLADRGERVDKVIHFLKAQPKVEFTWGNHDIIWMGATLGSEVLIATVLRISLRYLRLWQLEEGYGILLSPLASLAKDVYHDDPATCFMPKRDADFTDEALVARMHKAISIIEFKLSGQMIDRHPEWEMEDRRHLHLIDYEKGVITLNGVTHELKDSHFPTISPDDPYALSDEEKHCISRLKESFIASQRLWEHMLFVVKNGAMYLKRDHVLIFHACIPTRPDGEFRCTTLQGQTQCGIKLFTYLDDLVRRTYREGAAMVSQDLDVYYWMWANGRSPLFGKSQMATFERYFIEDKTTHREEKDPYFDLIHDADFCRKVGKEFHMGDDVMIINGHVPVKIQKGEDPVKRGGNAVTIDGAFSEAYGDQGYTLMLRPREIVLAQHSHFESVNHFLTCDSDMLPELRTLVKYPKAKRLADTHEGQAVANQLPMLNELLQAYRSGEMMES